MITFKTFDGVNEVGVELDNIAFGEINQWGELTIFSSHDQTLTPSEQCDVLAKSLAIKQATEDGTQENT